MFLLLLVTVDKLMNIHRTEHVYFVAVTVSVIVSYFNIY